jgi:hypothetical protein
MTGRERAALELMAVIVAAAGSALLVAWLTYAPPPVPRPTPPPESPTRTIHLFDWQGGDLEVCQCVPGRVEPGPKVKRAGP